MKYTICPFLVLFSFFVKAQSPEFQIEGKVFAALSVTDVSSTSTWYEEIFGLKLLKEIKSPDGKVHIRVVGNEYLLFELLRNIDSKPLQSLGIDNASKVHGYFKIGIHVKGLDGLEKYLRARNVAIKHKFEDKEIGRNCLIISDINGQLIQFFELST